MMEVTIRASDAVKVTGDGFDDRTLQGGETFRFEGNSFNIAPAPAEEVIPPEQGADVFSPTNRPNGMMTAGVAPKMPKSSGELAQVQEGERTVERAVADVGVATQGGGPETKDGTTPGPQPDNPEGRLGQTGAATGDVDARGVPQPRTTEQVQKAPEQPKKK